MTHEATYQTTDALDIPGALLIRPLVLQAYGLGATRLREMVRAGLLPGPVPFGSTPRYVAAEVLAVCDAVKAGQASEDDLRALTARLLAQRGHGRAT